MSAGSAFAASIHSCISGQTLAAQDLCTGVRAQSGMTSQIVIPLYLFV